jgi:hypothetical protein
MEEFLTRLKTILSSIFPSEEEMSMMSWPWLLRESNFLFVLYFLHVDYI